MRLKFNPKNCIGCKLCQLACSGVKENIFNPRLARLDITSYYDLNDLKFDVSLCTMCLRCVEACPTEAITVKNGRLNYDREECIGCMVCVDECPEGVIKNKGDSVGLCDLCEGTPTCVQWCPHEALTLDETQKEVE